MRYVYKFMSYDAFLKTVTPAGIFLKVSSPIEFNDPFDCTGTAIGSWSPKFIEKYKGQLGDHVFDSQECLKCELEGRNLLGAAYRVICFADKNRMERNDREKLMWAHYADHCRGVRLSFDVTRLGFDLVDVRYGEKIPMLDFRRMTSFQADECKALEKFNHKCLTVKDICWNYECERRAIFDSKDPRIQNDENGVEVVEVPTDSLVEISLGSEVQFCEMLRRKLLSLGIGEEKFFMMERAGFKFSKRALNMIGTAF